MLICFLLKAACIRWTPKVCWTQLPDLQVTFPAEEETPVKSIQALQRDSPCSLSPCHALHPSFIIPDRQDAMCGSSWNIENQDVKADPPGSQGLALCSGLCSLGESGLYGSIHLFVQY